MPSFYSYLEWYQSYGADTNDEPLRDGRMDGQMDRHSKFVGYNIIPRHFFVAGHNTKDTESHQPTNARYKSTRPGPVVINCSLVAHHIPNKYK